MNPRIVSLVFASMFTWLHAGIEPVGLRCEYRENPLGIDAEIPRLQWKLTADKEERGIRQIAYQIHVASSEELLESGKADLWDSGKVESDQSIQVEYAGKPLESRIDCYWKVRVWSAAANGQPSLSGWSQPAKWSMGLLKPGDWTAKWIKPMGDQTSPWLRKEFTLDAAPDQATVYVNVKGYCDLFVNGVKVSEDVLSPAVTEYRKRTRYNTYDIAPYLKQGRNCVGAWMGVGLWYRRGEANPDPVPLARIQLDMTVNGKPVVVGTDASWTWMPSTHTEHWWDWNQNGREEIDMRRDVPGWSEAGCTEGDWKPVIEHPERTGVATAQACPPNRITEVIPVAKRTILNTNLVELDFGTNLTGWLKLRLPPMKSGDKIIMHFADKRFQTPGGDKTPIGNIGMFEPGVKKFESTTGPVAYQTMNQRAEYISAGKAGEEYCARFNYFAFRYVIIEGLPTPPKPEDAQALMIESNLDPVGDFACSNDLLNQIHKVNLWTIRCLNLGGYIVDCPHRERMGYGGDGQTAIESMNMNLDSAAFFSKWAVDWLDVQDPSTGKTAPFAPKNDDENCAIPWGSMIGVMPWKNYLYFGDRRLLEQAYDPMVLYVTKYVDSAYPDNGVERVGGDPGSDWCAPRYNMNFPPGNELFVNAYRVYLYDLLVRAAIALGKTEDVEKFQKKADHLRTLIHARYFKPEEGFYDSGRQLDQALPLLVGIVPTELRQTVEKSLEEIIMVKNKGHLDTGMLGTLFLFESLREMGRNDLAYTMATRTDFPGWGYLLSQGQTTFGEQWDTYWSQIHACYLSPSSWMAKGLGGILLDEAKPAFKHIIIKPAMVGDLTWVKCHYDSAHGRIVSNWTREGKLVTMNVIIPPNTTATVFVPAVEADKVTESGHPASKALGVKFLRMEKGAAVYAVGSGRYSFQSADYPEIPKPPKVEILRAVYGALPDGPHKEVTEQVREMVQGGALIISADNGSFGDPAPGHLKKLKLEYKLNDGEVITDVVEEYHAIQFGPPGVFNP